MSTTERMYAIHRRIEAERQFEAEMREWARIERDRKLQEMGREERFDYLLESFGREAGQPVERVPRTMRRHSNITGAQILIGQDQQPAAFAWQHHDGRSIAYLGPNPDILEGERILLSAKIHRGIGTLRHDEHRGIKAFEFAGAREFYRGPKVRVLAEDLAREISEQAA